MALMALLKRIQSCALASQLLLVLLLHHINVLATTDLAFYTNTSCEGTSSNATVSSIAHDGLCGHPGTNIRSLVATVSGDSQKYDCTEVQSRFLCAHSTDFDANMNLVTGYSDPNCSNDAKAASLGGKCTLFPFTIESYSVDCISVNSDMGDIEVSNGDGTNESATDAETSTSSIGPTSPGTETLSARTTTASIVPSQPFSSATSWPPPKSTQTTSVSSTSKIKASTLPHTTVTTNDILVDHVSTSAAATTTHSSHTLSSQPTNTSTNSNNNSNTNLSRNGEIAVGVVIPSVAIIVAIVIGIDQRRRFIWLVQGSSRRHSLEAQTPIVELPSSTGTREDNVPEGTPF